MPVQDVHRHYFRTSVALSRMQVKNVISPLDVIKVLNANRISFVLVGAHGLAGWMKKPRATQDVDVVIAERQVRKATGALLAAFPHLEADDKGVVVRRKDTNSGEVVIDLMKPRELYRQTFRHTKRVTEGKTEYRIPSLEMALAMKFAAMVSPNRQNIDKFQDAHDFGKIALANPGFDRELLAKLGDGIYNGGGEDLLETIRKMQAGEPLEL